MDLVRAYAFACLPSFTCPSKSRCVCLSLPPGWRPAFWHPVQVRAAGPIVRNDVKLPVKVRPTAHPHGHSYPVTNRCSLHCTHATATPIIPCPAEELTRGLVCTTGHPAARFNLQNTFNGFAGVSGAPASRPHNTPTASSLPDSPPLAPTHSRARLTAHTRAPTQPQPLCPYSTHPSQRSPTLHTHTPPTESNPPSHPPTHPPSHPPTLPSLATPHPQPHSPRPPLTSRRCASHTNNPSCGVHHRSFNRVV